MTIRAWLIACLVTLGFFSIQVSGQSYGCTNLAGYQVMCCGTPLFYYYNDDGKYSTKTTYTYCCGRPAPTSEVDLYSNFCTVVRLSPDVLDELFRISPSGNLLIASCSGALIPIPRSQKSWKMPNVHLLPLGAKG